MNNTIDFQAVATAIQNGNFSFEGYSEEQQAELRTAAEAFLESKRQDQEYASDLDQVVEHQKLRAEAAQIAKTQVVKDASQVGVTNLVDAAFTPDGSPSSILDKRGEMQSNSEKLHYDDDDAIIEISEDSDDQEMLQINEFSLELPANGEHHVHLAEYPQKCAGRNGNDDFRIFRIRDEENKIEWTKFISEPTLKDVFSDINFENKKILSSGGLKSTKDYLNILKDHEFTCWTVINKQDKVCTYFRLEGKGSYKAFLYYLSKQDDAKSKHSLVPAADQVAKPWEV